MNPCFRLILVGALCCIGVIGCGKAAPPSLTLPQAVERGDLNAIQQHVAAKSDLDKADTFGLTPLHLAAVKGDLPIVQALIAGGAKAGPKANNGKTPLEMAREKGHTAVAEFLQQRNEPRGRGLIDGGLGVSDAMDNM